MKKSFFKRKTVIENGIEYTVYTSIYDELWYYKAYMHRELGPAFTLKKIILKKNKAYKTYKAYYQYGKKCRKDGAAVIYSDGKKEYWLNGELFLNINSDDEWLIYNIIT